MGTFNEGGFNAQPRDGYRPVRLGRCTWRADDPAHAYLDPSSELVTVVDTGGVWAVSLAGVAQPTTVATGVSFVFRPRNQHGQRLHSGLQVVSWNATVQAISAPALGSGFWVMAGLGDHTGGSAWSTDIQGGGLRYTHATYPRVVSQRNTSLAYGTQATVATADRAYSSLQPTEGGRIASNLARAVDAAAPSDPRWNSSDTEAVEKRQSSIVTMSDPWGWVAFGADVAGAIAGSFRIDYQLITQEAP